MQRSSKSGEIALTLTIISLGMMLIGTTFGKVGLQKKPTSNKSQAAESCFYHAVAYVDKVVNGKRSKLTKSDYLNQPLTITNNLGYPSNMFDNPANPQSGEIEAVYEYPKKGIGAGNYKFGKHPTGYEDGDLAHVALNLNNKWRITQSECIPLLNSVDGTRDKGCNGNTIKLTSSNTISNFLVTCGVSMKYGWVVEPVNITPSELTPSPKPTAVPTTQAGIPAQCPYVANAWVLRADQTALLLSENGGSANFGISNDKQSQTIPAGKFGDSYLYGIKSSNAVKYAQYQYASDYEQFKPENPNALYTREAKPNGANVTLLGLGAGWRVTGTFCKPGLGARYGDKGCPASKDQGRDATVLKGFKPDCGVNINYGWYVERAPTPTPSPTITLARPTISSNPRLPILPTTAPTALPTKIPSPVPSATTVPEPSSTLGHIELEPIQDASVRSGSSYQNRHFGKEERLEIGYENYPNENPNYPHNYGIMASFIQFDLAKLQGTKIINAKLILSASACHYTEGHGQTSALAYVTLNKTPWDEDVITWSSLKEKKADINMTLGKVKYACDRAKHIKNADDNITFEGESLNKAVQQWADNSQTNFGLRLDPTAPGIANLVTSYNSRELDAAFTQWRPKLIIDFEGTPTNSIPNNKPVAPSSPAKSALSRRDLNGDEVVNVVDFVLILRKLGTKGTNMPEDFNNDGVVNTIDAASVIANFGKN